ncbi:hypothetical protein [Geomicrobium sediminis]|uniref:Uncharacterized protein n=1 Tax=Geomicrobium sediminis TaxID=1347788 RepID=A0ABS2PI23_9BACL|nr:hypothetical protein [Geomicrobium sediminis]MBM7634991.1 hypothetical protein [Geomicrobium sediminis]
MVSQNLNFLGFSKAKGIYQKAYEPYMEKREQAVMSLPIVIQEQEYRLLYSKTTLEPLYTKMIVLYNDGQVVFDTDETHRCLYASHGLTLYKEPESQFDYDVRQGEPKRRSSEIEGLKKLIDQGSGLFDQTEQEVIKNHLEYYIGLKEVGKPLSEVGQQLIDHKRELERSEKVTEEQLLSAIELYDERTKQRDAVERLLFSNGEYTRKDTNNLFRKHRRDIIKLIGRRTYRRIVNEIKGAENASPRIIRETNQVYERNMNSKTDFLTFLDQKPTVKEMFINQSEKVMDLAWILSSNYTK